MWLSRRKRRAALFAIALIVAAAAAAAAEPPRPEAAKTLKTAQARIREAFERLDTRLAAATRQIAKVRGDEQAVRRILARLAASDSSIIDCCLISREGVISLIEPPAYRHSEGENVAQQEQIQRLWRTRQPVLSDVFKAVERVCAMDLEHPLLDKRGRLVGSVSILFRPDQMIVRSLPAALIEGEYEIIVMQTDGLILYDARTSETGRNIFTDPLYQKYPEALALGRRNIYERRGLGTYGFRAEEPPHQPVTLAELWDTISLHGTEWRVLVDYRLN